MEILSYRQRAAFFQGIAINLESLHLHSLANNIEIALMLISYF